MCWRQPLSFRASLHFITQWGFDQGFNIYNIIYLFLILFLLIFIEQYCKNFTSQYRFVLRTLEALSVIKCNLILIFQITNHDVLYVITAPFPEQPSLAHRSKALIAMDFASNCPFSRTGSTTICPRDWSLSASWRPPIEGHLINLGPSHHGHIEGFKGPLIGISFCRETLFSRTVFPVSSLSVKTESLCKIELFNSIIIGYCLH